MTVKTHFADNYQNIFYKYETGYFFVFSKGNQFYYWCPSVLRVLYNFVKELILNISLVLIEFLYKKMRKFNKIAKQKGPGRFTHINLTPLFDIFLLC